MACQSFTTPHCGRVVTDGVDGFIVPARDVPALADCLRNLLDDPERLQAMGEAARTASTRFSLEKLGTNLRSLETKLKGAPDVSLPDFA
jgi:glycosyltransferase involved in cell wall biosynthesis